jgi:hypothetical protein
MSSNSLIGGPTLKRKPLIPTAPQPGSLVRLRLQSVHCSHKTKCRSDLQSSQLAFINHPEIQHILRRVVEPGHNEVKAVAENVEKDAVPKMGEAGPAVDSGYVLSDASERGMLELGIFVKWVQGS